MRTLKGIQTILRVDKFYNQDDRFSDLIDYGSLVRTVYIRACELWHAGSGSQFDYLLPGDSIRELSFLDWVLDDSDENNFNLPSWVPNWVQKGPAAMAQSGPKYAAGIGENLAVNPKVVFPSVNQFSSTAVPVQARGAVLFPLHCVAVVSCPTNNMRIDHVAEHAEALSLFSDPHPTTKMSYTKAWQMALEPEVWLSRFQEMERTRRFWDAAGVFEQIYNPARARVTPLTTGEIISGVSVSVLTAIRTHTSYLAYKRSLVVTPNGFIGLAPGAAMVGDVIAILFGGRTPYILRKLPIGKVQILGSMLPSWSLEW